MQNNHLIIEDEFQEIGIKTIDDRRRITLGELLHDFKRVRVYRNQRGELLLQPLAEIPASEVWLFRDRDALKAVEQGLKDAAKGRISKLDLDEL